MTRVLVLGGSALTDDVGHALKSAGHDVSVYWSRGPMSAVLPMATTLRAGLDGAGLLVDTTHPFDDTLRGLALAFAADVPRVRVGRPAWTPAPQDRWTEVEDLAQAVAALPSGARVFAASGRDSAEVLAHHDGPVYLRQLHHHDDVPPVGCTFVFGDGPFDVESEITLFQNLEIDALLARNMGGVRGFPKLAAARTLGLPVVLISPPETGFEIHVPDAGALLDWLGSL
ncbi:precorrin-6A/cobalt-precorrin-6A reductase [uncultured Tateyamaria sp.]|uniref:precorrin-6A/cobalt-precorrin-6A reductase n=1 Tax=uncultured Tateyamaria sp. TaxID=455651 RepID=UPI0026258DF5|nr:precorrin-6A/cobalt-precorrin-6A reductase [uncultured Tateyamaria sp.]